MQKITRFLALLGELMIEKAEDAAAAGCSA